MEQSTGNNSSFMPRLTERNALKNSLKLDDEPVHSKKHNFKDNLSIVMINMFMQKINA